jgi:hypothetical protein
LRKVGSLTCAAYSTDIGNRLLLKCGYAKYSRIPSPLPSLNGSTITLKSHCSEVIDHTEALVQGLSGVAIEDRSSCRRVSSLIEMHKQQFDVMVETFYDSYHKWVPIVNRESLREYNNATQPDICRGLIVLTLTSPPPISLWITGPSAYK